MAGPKRIRSLARGLQVLHALQATPIASLHALFLATRIPKPTLLRILVTLEEMGAVSRRLGDGHYRISALNRVARKRDRYDRVAEAAAPVLDRLCRRVSWPSDLMVPAGDHMEIRETSLVRTPFSTYFMHERIGKPVNWVLSAVGRAYLAYCPDKEREKILTLLRKSNKAENWLARDVKRFDRILADTRRNGFGVRDGSYVGGTYGQNDPDGLAGIAVPLLDGGRVYGVINIIWAKAAHSVEDMARHHLADLQDAAAEIAVSLRT
jgi:IclR family transcriptional regulator, mhp operon transcriptional activator